MHEFQEVANLCIAPEQYVYKIMRVGKNVQYSNVFAAISSDDRLSYFALSSTAQGHLVGPLHTIDQVHRGVACIQRYDDRDLSSEVFITAGRDGLLKVWDGIASNAFSTFQTARGEPISAIACRPFLGLIAAGTDTDAEKIGDVVVYLWNVNSNNSQPSQAYTEIHSNSITAILFHPHNNKLLITAATDCLINVIQIDIPDEDDAILSTATHDAAIHHIAKAIPVVDDQGDLATPTVHAISHDERASSYQLDNGTLEELKGSQLDIKQRMKMDYTICARSQEGDPGIWLCMGVNKPETDNTNVTIAMLTHYAHNQSSVITPAYMLKGGHGEEVVRDIWWGDEESYGFGSGMTMTIMTAGEDGCIRLWHSKTEETKLENAAEVKVKKHKNRTMGENRRYTPY